MADEYDSVGGGGSGAASGAMSGAMAGAAFGPIGMGVGAVIGGLFGSQKTKVPRPPSYGKMMNTNIDSQRDIQAKLLALEGTYRPQYQGLQERTLQSQLYGGDGNLGYINMLNQSNEALQGVQARAGAGYMRTLGGLTNQARGLMQSDQARAMHESLMNQAQSDLAMGTALNADEQRQAFQSANSAMAMRGLGGRQGVAAGVLSNYGMGQNRLNQRRQFAGGMLSQDSALQSAALQAGSNAMNMYNAGGSFMGQANAVLGQYQPQIFQPESQMGAQAQGMKYQHEMGLARASMQQQQQLLGTMTQMGVMGMQGGFNGIFSGGGINTDFLGRSINLDGGGMNASGNWNNPIGPALPSWSR